jgi:hypothetical protein
MTVMHTAFANARFFNRGLLTKVGNALGRYKPKLSRDAQRGWSTNISFRTYNALKNQGVLE